MAENTELLELIPNPSHLREVARDLRQDTRREWWPHPDILEVWADRCDVLFERLASAESAGAGEEG